MAKRTVSRRTDGVSFRNFDGAWYSSLTGKYLPLRDQSGNKIKGKENEAAALLALARLRVEVAERGPVDPTQPATLPTLKTVANLYLDKLSGLAPKNYKLGKRYLADFVQFVGADTRADRVPRSALTNWLLSHKAAWGANYQVRGISVIVAAYNWAIERGYLPLNSNQFAKFKRPQTVARISLIEVAQEALLLEYAPTPLAEFVRFLLLTGCRPDEAARIEASMVTDSPEGVIIVLHAWKNAHKVGKPRIIYCDGEASMMIRRLSAKYPSGLLFRNRLGGAWADNTRRESFRSVRERIQRDHGAEAFPNHITLYSCRHTWITRRLASGTPQAVIAELAGTSARMIEKHYGHLNRCQSVLWAAVRGNAANALVA